VNLTLIGLAGRIFRYEIPIDGGWHKLDLTGPIVHVATREASVVEVWAVHHDDMPTVTRTVSVFGTGRPFPESCVHLGTAIIPGGLLVWHLLERVG
jgi:hypothetical protein